MARFQETVPDVDKAWEGLTSALAGKFNILLCSSLAKNYLTIFISQGGKYISSVKFFYIKKSALHIDRIQKYYVWFFLFLCSKLLKKNQ